MHGGRMLMSDTHGRLRGERLVVPRPRPAAEDALRALPRAPRSAPAWVRRTLLVLMCVESLAAGAVGGVQLLGRQDPSWAVVGGCAGLLLVWPSLLAVTGAYSPRVFGTGSDEYRRVGRAA